MEKPITVRQAISALKLVDPDLELFLEDGSPIYTLHHNNKGVSQEKAVFVMADQSPRKSIFNH